jgi:hypothetical protein
VEPSSMRSGGTKGSVCIPVDVQRETVQPWISIFNIDLFSSERSTAKEAIPNFAYVPARHVVGDSEGQASG